jgi:hypothetical protein
MNDDIIDESFEISSDDYDPRLMYDNDPTYDEETLTTE